jgi:hypothetical protein
MQKYLYTNQMALLKDDFKSWIKNGEGFNEREGLLAAIRQSFWFQEKVAKEVFATKKFNYGLTF